MKLETRTVLCLDFVIDSSEALMFTKGGKCILKLDVNDVDNYDGDDPIPGLCSLIKDATEVQISFSMDSSHQSRFDYIKDCARKHKEENPTPDNYDQAKMRMKERTEKAVPEADALKKYHENHGNVKQASSEGSSDPSSSQD